MSSDDDSDFGSSSNCLSDEDETMQCLSRREAAGASRCTWTRSSAQDQPAGNIFTDAMNYVTFSYHDATTPANAGKTSKHGQENAVPRELGTETTLLSHNGRCKFQDVESEPAPPAYGSIVNTASLDAMPRAQDEASTSISRRHYRCGNCSRCRDEERQDTCQARNKSLLLILIIVIWLGFMLVIFLGSI